MIHLILYSYPYKPNDKTELLNSNNIPIHPRVKNLYHYLYGNGRIEDLEFNPKVLNIFSRDVLTKIRNCNEGDWEQIVPDGVAKIIKANSLFGWSCDISSKKD